MSNMPTSEKRRPTHDEIVATPRSTFVDVLGMPWKQSKFPGVEVKLLFDDGKGILTVLTRMAPAPLSRRPGV